MIIALSRQRIASIDAFRGLTILVMVFVNQLAHPGRTLISVRFDSPRRATAPQVRRAGL